MSLPRKVRVGFIGSGSIAQGKHVTGHLLVPNVELVACSDVHEPTAREFAERNGIPHTFMDYDRMLEMDEIDAVSVCTPNMFHAAPTIAALNAGKHVICEKPIAGNATDGAKMVAAARKSGKILQIGLQSRFNPTFWTLHKRIEQGILGQPYYARTMSIRRRSTGMPDRATFLRKEIAGGGCLLDIGVHCMDLMLFVLGYPRPLEAFGMTYRKFGNAAPLFTKGAESFRPEDYDVEDCAVGQVKFETGLTITVETAWASNTGPVGTDFIVGDKAGASLSSPVKIFEDRGPRGFDERELEPLKRTPTEFGAFHHSIRKALPSLVPGEQVLQLAKVFDAIYKSAEIGHSVRVA